MTLIVDAPPAYEPERRYILDVVIAQWLGLDWNLRLRDRVDVRVTVAGDDTGRQVTLPERLFATDARHWLTDESLPVPPLMWLPTDDGTRLPVLYGDGSAVLIATDGPTVHLGVDVLGAAFFMLTRYEELVLGERDAYGRFPASASVAQREGFVGIPVVDEYVELLWNALQRLWPRLQRRPRRYAAALTHDVDHPLAFLGRPRRDLVRQLGGDVLVRRDPALAARRVGSWAGIRRGEHRLDPYNTFDFLMEVSERLGVASCFYFLANNDVSHINGFYTMDDRWVRALMRRVDQRGHYVGYHGGFETYRDGPLTSHEFTLLRTAAAELGIAPSVWGGRQHYLRWENPETWANWERAGLDYDSTVGYAEVVGFRAGTCHEYRAFDLRDRRALDLNERPMHVMDTTLFEYMKLTPERALEAALDVARTCRRVQGTFTLICHNSMLPTAARRRWYEALAEAVTVL